jgi:replication initiation protein RepC
METENRALDAHRERIAGHPTGFRRLTPGGLNVDRMAEGFAGLPEGVTVPGQVLAALKAAAPRLGLPMRLVHAVDWLFRFTQPQDWGRGGRPMVWPSAELQRQALGLSATQAKAVNRQLIEAGLVSMRDSPNGKRYGRRDGQGRIVEAYGFDLSPLASRHAEFLRLAEEERAERAETGRLRRRATIARKGIVQILETVAEHGFAGEEWAVMANEAQELTRGVRSAASIEGLVMNVEGLERRQRAARERLEGLFQTVKTDPMGPENRPHILPTNEPLYPLQDTVIAAEGCSRAGTGREAGRGERFSGTGKRDVAETGRVLKLHPEELVRLAPRLKLYLRNSSPTWPEIVDAADWLRHDLDVSKPLWGEACVTLGREVAAIALAIVSTKDAEHFRTTAGGYFHGMVAKGRAGELNLDRTLWALRGRDGSGPAAATGQGLDARPRPGRAPSAPAARPGWRVS